MGLWWKSIKAEVPLDPAKYVRFEGDPKALSKKWRMLWRFFQNWHIIKVEGATRYRFFFSTESEGVKQFREWLILDFVAVRVGPEPVTFWAVSESGEPLILRDMSIVIPGYFREDTRHDLMVHFANHYRPQTEFI